MYNYFVSYYCTNKNGQQGTGCTMVKMEEKITSKTNISDLCNELAEISKNVDNVAILNFILLDE